MGRQGITFQEGILINDTVDAIGLIRNNLSFPGTSNLRISGMWAWDRLDRNDRSRGSNANMYALFTAIDAPVSTFNIDTIYVDDNADDNAGNALYVGLSSIQRIRALGNFTQAGREVILGGPLANTGILFASPNLSTHGAEINPFVNDDYGFAIGYQAFYDHRRRNLILELSTKKDFSGDGNDSLGIGYQLQQAIGQYVQLQLESFYTFNNQISDGAGARFEVLVVY